MESYDSINEKSEGDYTSAQQCKIQGGKIAVKLVAYLKLMSNITLDIFYLYFFGKLVIA